MREGVEPIAHLGPGFPRRATRRGDAVIRGASQEDLPELRRIIVEAFGHSTIHYLIEERFGIVGTRTWNVRKADEIADFFRLKPEQVLVTEIEGRIAGFTTYDLDDDRKIGVIGNNAVDPSFQERGIGTNQIQYVLGLMREKGMRIAEVRTGLGPEYAPARRVYEKCGFSPTMESAIYHLSLG